MSKSIIINTGFCLSITRDPISQSTFALYKLIKHLLGVRMIPELKIENLPFICLFNIQHSDQVWVSVCYMLTFKN